MYDQHHTRFLSRPVDLHWVGWRSDTFTLQQQGWSISASQDVASNTMRIALNNRHVRMQGISEEIGWPYRHAIVDCPPDRSPIVPIRLMGGQIKIHVMGMPHIGFSPVDAYPQMTNEKITSLDDLAHFAPALTRTRQLIVPEENVDDLMQRILDMQHGSRIERIREDVRNGDYTDRQNFHAQIISFKTGG